MDTDFRSETKKIVDTINEDSTSAHAHIVNVIRKNLMLKQFKALFGIVLI